MRTQKQIEASRRNGALSRGPVTAAGKRASSQNGIRHGILAASSILNGESKDAYDQMMHNLVAELQPETVMEIALVKQLGLARWRQMRAWNAEKASLDKQMGSQTSGSGPDRLAQAIETDRASISNMYRHETAFSRLQRSTLRQLKLAKALRTAGFALGPF